MSSPIGTLVGRWLSGRRLVGKHPSASTFLRRDDQAARRYYRHSGLRRLAYRVLFVSMVAGLGFSYHADPHRTVGVVLVVLLVFVVGGLGALGYGAYTFRHSRFEVAPLYAKLAHELKGLPPSASRRQFRVPRSWDSLSLQLPKDCNPTNLQRRRVLNVVEEHTGRDYDTDWRLAARPPRVTFKARPHPPKVVPWAQILPMLSDLGPSQILLGLDGYSRPRTYDMDYEAPHLLLSMGTGAGKSTALMSLICQLLRKTGEGLVDRIVVLDVKHESVNCLDGVERVEIYRRADEIAQALSTVQSELDARMGGSGRRGRVVLIVEESNLFTEKLQSWWADTRKDSDPKRCPALSTVSEVLLAGRAFRMNVTTVAQHASVAATGGGGGATGGTASRSQYGVVVLCRFDPKIWKSFTGRPEASAPKLKRTPGTAILLEGGSTDEAQLVLIDPAQARADALAHSGAATAELPAVKEPTFSLREVSDDYGLDLLEPSVSYSALRRRKATDAQRGEEWLGDGGKPERFTLQQLTDYNREWSSGE